jgi:hypothetical protein
MLSFRRQYSNTRLEGYCIRTMERCSGVILPAKGNLVLISGRKMSSTLDLETRCSVDGIRETAFSKYARGFLWDKNEHALEGSGRLKAASSSSIRRRPTNSIPERHLTLMFAKD